MQKLRSLEDPHTRRRSIMYACRTPHSSFTRSPYPFEPEPEPEPSPAARDLLVADAEGATRKDEDDEDVPCNSGLRAAPLARLGDLPPSEASSSSIRSPPKPHSPGLRPRLVACWFGGACCSSLSPALARIATLRIQPSRAPPMFSRPVDAFDVAVDSEPKEDLRRLSGTGGSANWGMCCEKNLLSPSMAGPGPVAVGSSVPTPVPVR